MQTINLYRYIRPGGGVSTSPVKPEGEYTLMYRLVADEGKLLTNGEVETSCIDTAGPAMWMEIDAPEEEDLDVH